MKKLEISQMENLLGGANGRNCMLLGFIAGAALALGPIGAIGWATASGISGGALVTAASADCF